MAEAFKCDRCGKYCDKTPHKLTRKVIDLSNFEPVYITYEFCDDCEKDFQEFCKGAAPKNLLERLRDMINKE